jgi:hypothetical protein
MNLFSASNSGLFSGGPVTDKRLMWVYVLGILFFFVAILMILNYRFNLLPSYLDPRTTKSQEFWAAPDALTPLRVTTTDVRTKIPTGRYTVMFEMVWINTRTAAREGSGAFPYRHILHRGSGELGATQDQLLDIRATETVSVGGAAAIAPFGLPSRMNPGVMADPYTNDMLIFIDTASGNNMFLRESLRIADIPLDQPFYLAIVVLENVLEVYLNCRLEATKVLEGLPRTIDQEWYGLTGPHALAGQVQRLKLWDHPLNHKELRDLCPLPILFGPNMKCPEGGATGVLATKS